MVPTLYITGCTQGSTKHKHCHNMSLDIYWSVTANIGKNIELTLDESAHHRIDFRCKSMHLKLALDSIFIFLSIQHCEKFVKMSIQDELILVFLVSFDITCSKHHMKLEIDEFEIIQYCMIYYLDFLPKSYDFDSRKIGSMYIKSNLCYLISDFIKSWYWMQSSSFKIELT